MRRHTLCLANSTLLLGPSWEHCSEIILKWKDGLGPLALSVQPISLLTQKARGPCRRISVMPLYPFWTPPSAPQCLQHLTASLFNSSLGTVSPSSPVHPGPHSRIPVHLETHWGRGCYSRQWGRAQRLTQPSDTSGLNRWIPQSFQWVSQNSRLQLLRDQQQ